MENILTSNTNSFHGGQSQVEEIFETDQKNE